ncbi:MAG: hypothetical protein C6W56_06395 [Caldibacillus debilis]|nr:MAG: hypothetical protein C6W56_06395 [Caldibacillus debilis]
MSNKDKQHGLRETSFIKFRHDDYMIIIAMHSRFAWIQHTDSKYMYFMYITRLQKRFIGDNTSEVAEFNILCFFGMNNTFSHLIQNVQPILSEYILDSKKIVEIVMLCEELYDNDEDRVDGEGML